MELSLLRIVTMYSPTLEWGFCEQWILRGAKGLNPFIIFEISGGACPESAEVLEMRWRKTTCGSQCQRRQVDALNGKGQAIYLTLTKGGDENNIIPIYRQKS